MTYRARFAVMMDVGNRVERYCETNIYAQALESKARVERCFPGRRVVIRDTRMNLSVTPDRALYTVAIISLLRERLAETNAAQTAA